jgi:mono/diheme cytochrome c family protein
MVAVLTVPVALAQDGETGPANEDRQFVESVWPIVSQHCLTCHGPFYQLAGLRLDSAERLLRGSENGAILEPGEPDSSELMRRISLPENDGDRMPQKAKRLTPQEIDAIRAWIGAGANFGSFVDADSLP